MARRIRESSIEKYLIERCKAARGKCYKVQPIGNRGAPDRVCALPGRLFFVETKKPRNSQYEALQLRTHQKLRDMGHTVVVCFTREQVDELFA